jgi:HPt (histidine-containing phosphotransfer) domain-containing protein
MPSRQPNTTRAIRLDDLLDLVAGDVDLLREVADLGAHDVDRLLGAIDEAPTAFAMATLAHELKGVLLNLTAAAAAKRAAAVETAARSGDQSAARAELARARPELDEIVATLASVAAESQRVAS